MSKNYLEPSTDSIKTIALHYGIKHQKFSLRDILVSIGESEGSNTLFKETITKFFGNEVIDTIKEVEHEFASKDSKLWLSFASVVGEEIRKQSENEIPTPYIDELVITNIQSFDNISLPDDLLVNLLNRDSINWEDLDITLFLIEGILKIGLEGILPWPLPDPDAIISWRAKARLIGTNVKVYFRIRFSGVEGPGIAWLLGALGLFTGGTLWAIGGVGVGIAIDKLYEAGGEGPEVEEGLTNAYKNVGEVIRRSKPALDYKLVDEKTFEIIMDVKHSKSSLHGLFIQLSK